MRVMDKNRAKISRGTRTISLPTVPLPLPIPANEPSVLECGLFSRRLLSFIYLFGDVFSLGRWVILSVFFSLPLKQMNHVISCLK